VASLRSHFYTPPDFSFGYIGPLRPSNAIADLAGERTTTWGGLMKPYYVMRLCHFKTDFYFCLHHSFYVYARMKSLNPPVQTNVHKITFYEELTAIYCFLRLFYPHLLSQERAHVQQERKRKFDDTEAFDVGHHPGGTNNLALIKCSQLWRRNQFVNTIRS
jgi:hypothetical protein